MYLCMYVFMYLCIYVSVYVYMFVLTIIARFQALIAQTAAEQTPCNHRKHKIQLSDKVEK